MPRLALSSRGVMLLFLFRLAVQCHFAVVAAEFAQFQPVRGVARILTGRVIAVVALGALKREVGAVALWHFIKSSLNHVLHLEPTTGIEPATYSLQNCCSTVELRRHG